MVDSQFARRSGRKKKRLDVTGVDVTKPDTGQASRISRGGRRRNL